MIQDARLVLVNPGKAVDTVAHQVGFVLPNGQVRLKCGRIVSSVEEAPVRWSDICFGCDPVFHPGDIVTARKMALYPGHRVKSHLADVVTLECGLRLLQGELIRQDELWPVHRGCKKVLDFELGKQ